MPTTLNAYHTTKMRSFRREISSNRRPRSELSTEQCAALQKCLEVGGNATKLAQQFGVARSTVYQAQQHFQNQHSLDSGTRSSRPEKFSQVTKCYISQMVRWRPGIS
jgi:transposase-like protein